MTFAPNTDMRALYLWLFGTWLPRSGREPADAPVFEEYLNNSRDLRPIIARTIVCVIGEAGGGNWTVRGKEAATSGSVSQRPKVPFGRCFAVDLEFGYRYFYGLRRCRRYPGSPCYAW